LPFRTRFTPTARRQIASWGLPDSILVDVYLYLNETLPRDPQRYLRRERELFDGMQCRFRLLDPDNRLCEYGFVFHVAYGADEQTLWVTRGGCLRQIGM
jgi:hypothetical protein